MAKKGMIFLEKTFTALDLVIDILDLDIPNDKINRHLYAAATHLKYAFAYFNKDVDRSLGRYGDKIDVASLPKDELPF